MKTFLIVAENRKAKMAVTIPDCKARSIDHAIEMATPKLKKMDVTIVSIMDFSFIKRCGASGLCSFILSAISEKRAKPRTVRK